MQFFAVAVASSTLAALRELHSVRLLFFFLTTLAVSCLACLYGCRQWSAEILFSYLQPLDVPRVIPLRVASACQTEPAHAHAFNSRIDMDERASVGVVAWARGVERALSLP